MDVKKTVDTLVGLHLTLYKQTLITILMVLERDILTDEDTPDHHKRIKADLIEDIIKIVKSTDIGKCNEDGINTESIEEETKHILGGSHNE